MYHTSYYVATLFSVPGHQRFNSLNQVKFKRRIRNYVARSPQTASYFVLVISKTELLSQVRYLFFFNYLYTNIVCSSGQKCDVPSVLTLSHSDHWGGFSIRTPAEFKFPRTCLKMTDWQASCAYLVLLIELFFNDILLILLASVGKGFGYTVSNMTLGNGMLGFLQV